MGRVLVLHPGAVGDLLLSIPALRALRARASGDELVLAAQPRIGRLLAALGLVDRSLDLDTLGLETLFGEAAPPERLRRVLADARVVSWFGSRDPGFSRRVSALAAESVVASTVPPAGTPVWRHLVASVGVPGSLAPPDEAGREVVELPPAMVDAGRRALAEAGGSGARPLAILHPGAGGASKRWAVEGFAETAAALVEAVGVDVAVHEGPADHAAVAALRARLRVPVVELVEPPLETLAGALRHVALWIGNDSGVSHLAAAVGAPALVLFTAANLAWRPWARRARVRVVRTGPCSPGDVDAVVADATALLAPRHARAAGGREMR